TSCALRQRLQSRNNTPGLLKGSRRIAASGGGSNRLADGPQQPVWQVPCTYIWSHPAAVKSRQVPTVTRFLLVLPGPGLGLRLHNPDQVSHRHIEVDEVQAPVEIGPCRPHHLACDLVS